MRLLGDVARLNARRFGAEAAIIFEDRRLSFAELDRAARGIAAMLRDRGVTVGDRVAILAENGLEFLPVYFAIVRMGAIAVPLNFRCATGELVHMMRDSGACVLFHTALQGPAAEALATACPDPIGRMLMDEALLSLPGDMPDAEIDPAATAVIMYTSGTTGVPKGVMLPHRSLIEQAAGTALATGLRHADRIVITTPLFHGSGLYVTGHSHLYVGASLVLARRFAAEEQVMLIERHAATTFFGVPTQYAMLLEAAGSRQGAPGSLRNGWYGGAPMPAETLAQAQRLWPEVRFQQLYGQTETTVTTVLAAEDHARKLGTVGRELPNCEMRVMGDDGACAAGTVGEVVVRQEAGMSGYHNNPAQTAATIRDGWIHTGDLGFLDEDGFLTLVDRKRDVILSGGENVYPAEIEAVLVGHDAVAEAAVIGAPDARWGEVPLAFVVPCGEAPDPTLLERWCEAGLARYKVPRQWRFVAALPRTANGKVCKPELRAALAAETAG